jgi:hypothetical protein
MSQNHKNARPKAVETAPSAQADHESLASVVAPAEKTLFQFVRQWFCSVKEHLQTKVAKRKQEKVSCNM